jgi:3-dehydroquinate dehydratase-1
MLSLGSLQLGGIPKVVVSIHGIHHLKMIRKIPFDLVEFRADLFPSHEINAILPVLAKLKGYPSIVTIRSKKEGGQWRLSEERRLDLFREMMPYVDAIDIELSAKTILGKVVSTAHQKKKRVIVSYHDFKKTPPLSVLNRIVEKGRAAGGDLIKIATMVKKRSDLQLLADFTLTNKKKPIITIGMGPIGALSRIFFPAVGSLLTYAYIDQPTAPGQIHCVELAELIKRFY